MTMRLPAACLAGISFMGWAAAQENHMSLELTSPAFGSGEDIPARYTCEGSDVSPPLRWTDMPGGTQSLALILDDPDAPDPADPKTTWVHWVLYDIPPDAAGLPEDVERHGLPAGARVGVNDWERQGYGGPCPPVGRHRYFHKLYVLDVKLGDLDGPTKEDLEAVMEGHVLARAELIGAYAKAQ